MHGAVRVSYYAACVSDVILAFMYPDQVISLESRHKGCEVGLDEVGSIRASNKSYEVFRQTRFVQEESKGSLRVGF